MYGEPLIDSALFHSWRRKLAAAALRAGPTYPAAGGYLPLRRAIADYLARRRGVLCNASDILIVAGTQQALTLVERVLLDPGDRVIVEDPHYQLAVHSLLAHGARVKSARTDEEGLVVSELPQRRHAAGIRHALASISLRRRDDAEPAFGIAEVGRAHRQLDIRR